MTQSKLDYITLLRGRMASSSTNMVAAWGIAEVGGRTSTRSGIPYGDGAERSVAMCSKDSLDLRP